MGCMEVILGVYERKLVWLFRDVLHLKIFLTVLMLLKIQNVQDVSFAGTQKK